MWATNKITFMTAVWNITADISWKMGTTCTNHSCTLYINFQPQLLIFERLKRQTLGKGKVALCLTKHHAMKTYHLLNQAHRHEDVFCG
jgi:hypothetical protein